MLLSHSEFRHIGTILIVTLAWLVSSSAHAQLTTGGVAGWVVADTGADFGDIGPGQNSTTVLSGPGVFAVPVPISDSSPDGAAFGQTEFPEVRALADSTVLSSVPFEQTVYAGAYWGDRMVFTGGVGPFELEINWSLDGAMSGAGGSYSVGGAPDTGGLPDGSAAANFRVFLSAFGISPLDLSETDLIKDLALEYSGFLEVPFFDPQDPFSGNNGPSNGNFLFPEYDEMGIPTGGIVEGYFTDENGSQLLGLGGSTRFNWTYGMPLDIGILVEVWATGGGIADFSQTGTLAELVVPVGTMLSSESGGSYELTFIPEPAFISGLWLACLGLGLVRRR